MSLDLVKCGICDEAVVITAGHRHLCEGCRGAEHELYSRVRALVLENIYTKYTIQDAADVLKVEERQIKHLVDSGFIKLTMRGIQLL